MLPVAALNSCLVPSDRRHEKYVEGPLQPSGCSASEAKHRRQGGDS